MAKNRILGINYTPPNYHLVEVSSNDVPANVVVGDRVRVPERPVSNVPLSFNEVRKRVDGLYVIQAPSGRETMLIVEMPKRR